MQRNSLLIFISSSSFFNFNCCYYQNSSSSNRLRQLESLKLEFDSLIYKRALHCITEDARTLETVQSLKNNNYSRVGELMTQSHFSLQNDYEVN